MVNQAEYFTVDSEEQVSTPKFSQGFRMYVAVSYVAVNTEPY